MNIRLIGIFLYTYVYVVGGIRFLGLYKIYNNMYSDNSVNEKISIHLPTEILGAPDDHGCMVSSGYSYCNYTDSCHRFDKPCIFNYFY
jgi:hypothetical protein